MHFDGRTCFPSHSPIKHARPLGLRPAPIKNAFSHRMAHSSSSSVCGPRHRLRAHCSSSSSGCGPRHRHGSLVLILGLRPAPQAASSLAAARATGCELTDRPPPRAARPPAALRREAPCRSPTSACPARPATKSSATPRSRTLCPPSNLQ